MDENKKKEVFVPVEAPKVDPMMIVRTVVFAVAILNVILSLFGVNPIEVDQEALYNVISAVFLLGAGFKVWDKNNDYSEKARKRKAIIEQVEEDE